MAEGEIPGVPENESEHSNQSSPTTEDVSVRSATADELRTALHDIGNEEIAHVFEELINGRQIASIYIDARSGGVFLGESEVPGVNSLSDVHVYQTTFQESVTGSVSTGSGQIQYGFTGNHEGNTPLAIGRVLANDIKKILSVYIPPPAYKKVQEVLKETHVVVLQGPIHVGKWTTAVHILAEWTSKMVCEISPQAVLEKLVLHSWQSGSGYVIDTLPSEQASSVSCSQLDRLSNQLQEKKSYIVLTVDSSATLRADVAARYLVSWSEIPDPQALLDKHIAWYITSSDKSDSIADLAQRAEVQELLASQLLPKDLDRLAELLVRVAGEKLAFDEALMRFSQRIQAQIKEWLFDHTNIHERTLMLTVSFLNGAAQDSILEADEQLRKMLLPPAALEKQTKQMDYYFGPTIEQRLDSILARTVAGQARAEFGSYNVTRVVLRNPELQPAIIGYIWKNFDRLREPLLEWLSGLVQDGTLDIQMRAAAAAGELATYDFARLRRELLLPWAKHTREDVRAAAALALGIPVWESKSAPHILNLLHHWSTTRNNWRLLWTSAAAYGGLAGLRFPDVALMDLRTIAGTGDIRLLNVILGSISALFEEGRHSSDFYEKVLGALHDWTGPSSTKIIRFTALLVFLDLCLHSKVKASPPEGAWPTVLWLVGERTDYRDVIVTLWRQALDAKETRKLSLEVLHRWISAADNDSRLLEQLSQVVQGITSEGREREAARLNAYLRRWAHKSSSASTLSTHLVAK